MDTLFSHCAGLDVHKKTVVACRVFPGPDGKQIQQVRTMTADLLELSDWLAEVGIAQVAMESTGEYWKPVYSIGSRSTICWRTTLNSGWSMPTTSSKCPVVRQTSKIQNGSLNCFSAVCFARALCPRSLNANFENSVATEPTSSGREPRRSTEFRRHWKG